MTAWCLGRYRGTTKVGPVAGGGVMSLEAIDVTLLLK
jgi:hypothetical protein